MNPEYEKEIGKKIRFYREKRKMTQELLSTKLQLEGCDITRSALAKIEVGQRHIYIDEFKTLVKLLDIEYEDIL
ncbi:MAG: helix-turn-helix transcriptional regulator [Clostridia bacterium]|nr:helix-turn-helix transcriptional regulator [Clostridia bacterium]MBQ7117582.1 helix-turn-helix transcriptional regulator [Clostridia bacterium]